MSDDDSHDTHDSYESENNSRDERNDTIVMHPEDEVERHAQSTEGERRYTSPIMTKFERAKILGIRAQQISMSAPVMVEYGDETDPLEIAKKELREKKTPLIVLRKLPDNTYEKWQIKDMINFYDRK